MAGKGKKVLEEIQFLSIPQELIYERKVITLLFVITRHLLKKFGHQRSFEKLIHKQDRHCCLFIFPEFLPQHKTNLLSEFQCLHAEQASDIV